MRFVVLDTESDGLAYEATKLHVMAYTEDGETIKVTHDYEEMKGVLSQQDCMFVCHNAVRHDLPLLNRILGLDLKYGQFVDTLALSWYLNFDNGRPGLGDYGVSYGIPKPKVDDWHGLSPEEYAHRVTEDVKINWKLWKDLERKLGVLYGWKN